MTRTFQAGALAPLMMALAMESGFAQAQPMPYPDPFGPTYAPSIHHYGYGPANVSPNVLGEPSEPEANPDELFLEAYRPHYYHLSLSHPYAASIDVKVPAGAQLWFEGQKTQQQGSYRIFESPPLEPGKIYSYKVKARWTNAKGEIVERTRTLQIHAGTYVKLDLQKD